MSSINTNLSAMTALQSLKATQTAMNKNQNQISTGLRVGEASHNASYWSISTKMKSDNGALGAVKDSLKQSKEMINTFSSAMEKSLGFLNTMKTKLAAGSNPGADLKSIQTELKGSIEGLKSVAASAIFNGQNWLQGDGKTVSLVTSYDGQAKELKFLDIDTSKINLFSKTAGGADILGTTGEAGVSVAAIDISDAAKPGALTFGTFSAKIGAEIGDGDVIKFKVGTGVEQSFELGSTMTTIDDVVKGINNDQTLSALVEARKVSTKHVDNTGKAILDVNGKEQFFDQLVLTSRLDGTAISGTYNNARIAGTADAAAGTLTIDKTDTIVRADDTLKFKVNNDEYELKLSLAASTSAADIQTAFEAKYGASTGVTFAEDTTAKTLTIDSTVTGAKVTQGSVLKTATADVINGAPTAPTSGNGTTVKQALKAVDEAINKITEGMAMLGANKALIESQEDFIGVLSDSLTAGVSAFIDADMNEVSTRNQALQTQQQLGVQALSMANQNSQMILKLFQ